MLVATMPPLADPDEDQLGNTTMDLQDVLHPQGGDLLPGAVHHGVGVAPSLSLGLGLRHALGHAPFHILLVGLILRVPVSLQEVTWAGDVDLGVVHQGLEVKAELNQILCFAVGATEDDHAHLRLAHTGPGLLHVLGLLLILLAILLLHLLLLPVLLLQVKAQHGGQGGEGKGREGQLCLVNDLEPKWLRNIHIYTLYIHIHIHMYIAYHRTKQDGRSTAVPLRPPAIV